MARVTLIEATPLLPDASGTVAVRLAGGGMRAYTYKGHNDWHGGIAGRPLFSAELAFDENGWNGGSTPATTRLDFSPSQRSVFSALAGFYWPRARITVSTGDDANINPAWTTRLVGTVDSISTEGSTISFTMADLSSDLAKPVVSDTFSGAGDLEGVADVAGRIKRRTWGYAFNIEGKILDPANNIYEFGDPNRPLLQFVLVKDKGYPASSTTVIAWQGSAIATLNALRAAAAPAGGAAVAPSIACVKWHTQPTGPLTADIRGEVAGGYVESAPEIAARVVAAYSDIGIANLVQAYGWRPAAAGWHVDDTSITVGNLLDQLLLPVSLLWVLDPSGVLVFRQWSWDTAPAAALRSSTISRSKVLPPLGRRRIGFQRNNRVHSDAEISALIDSSDLTYADGTPIDTLKPAQVGADRTIVNVAAAVTGQGPGATAQAIDVLNNYLTIGADGRLIGGGGGQVTYGGLGGGALGLLPYLTFGSSLLLEAAGGAIATLSAFKTGLGIASGITGQTAWATFGVSTTSLYSPNSNLFRYPRPVSGLTPAQIGWAIYDETGGTFGQIFPNDYAGFNGLAYGIARNGNYGAGTVLGYIDVPIPQDGGTYTVSWTGRLAGADSNASYVALMRQDKAYGWNSVGFTQFATQANGLGRYKATVQNVVDNSGNNSGQYGGFLRIHIGGHFPAVNGYQDIYWMDVKAEQGTEATPIGQSSNLALGGYNLLFQNGMWAEQLRPGEFGANVTEGRTAAGIAGQGALATLSSIGWFDTSKFTGMPYWAQGTFNAGAAGNNLLDCNRIAHGGTQKRLDEVYPGEWNANNTEGRTSAAITGQGAYATAPTIGRDNWGAYFYANTISLGYTITRSDGVNTVTESLVITQQGISAGFYGQGRGATSNNLADLDPSAASYLNGTVRGQQSIPIGFGQSTTITRTINNGLAITVNTQLSATSSSVNRAIRVDIWWKEYGQSSWNQVEGGTESLGPSEPAVAVNSTTIQNNSGRDKIYEIVAVGQVSNSSGVNAVPSESFLTA